MYLEGFATVYSETALAINALKKGEAIPDTVHFPTIGDGVDGMMFIDACVKSSKKGGNWVAFG